jgi:hypothetical protein
MIHTSVNIFTSMPIDFRCTFILVLPCVLPPQLLILIIVQPGTTTVDIPLSIQYRYRYFLNISVDFLPIVKLK